MASSGKSYRKVYSPMGGVYSQTVYISKKEHGKIMKAARTHVPQDKGNVYAYPKNLVGALTPDNKGVIYSGNTATRLAAVVLKHPNIKFDRNVRFIINDKKAKVKK